MQNASHTLEVVFEGAILVAGLFYLVPLDGWTQTHERSSRFSLRHWFRRTLPTEPPLARLCPVMSLLIACSTPLVLRSLRALLNSKPASRIKLMFAQKPSELPEKLRSSERLFGKADLAMTNTSTWSYLFL